jgi:hypothetical protein
MEAATCCGRKITTTEQHVSLSRMFKALGAEAGLPPIPLHDLGYRAPLGSPIVPMVTLCGGALLWNLA